MNYSSYKYIPRIRKCEVKKKINFKCNYAFESFDTTVQMWSNPAAFRLTFHVLSCMMGEGYGWHFRTVEKRAAISLKWKKNNNYL